MAIMDNDFVKNMVGLGIKLLEVINKLTGSSGLLKIIVIVSGLNLASVALNKTLAFTAGVLKAVTGSAIEGTAAEATLNTMTNLTNMSFLKFSETLFRKVLTSLITFIGKLDETIIAELADMTMTELL